MELLNNNKLHKVRFILRRSVGYVQSLTSILKAEKSSSRHELLHSTIKYLISSLKEEGDNNWKIKVHSLNVLKGIVSNSVLSNYLSEYYSELFIISVNGFNSEMYFIINFIIIVIMNRWAIKNSSLMLFTSIVLRMINTNKYQQNINNDSKSNYNYSFTQFFNLYPSLYNYLLNYFNEIKQYNRQNDLSIYPLILLLSHLKSDCLENNTSKYSSLDYFNGISSIGCSKNEMIRIITSKSLVYIYI